VLAQLTREPYGVEHLQLLGDEGLGAEGGGLLDGREGEELEQVVLDDVAGRADAVVVARASADADVLGHGDLHVVDVTAVPQRLEHRVREAQRQDVLDGLLAQVMVDAEDLVGVEDLVHDRVELLRARQIVAEGLLDDGAAPRALAALRESVLLQLRDDGREELRRHREIEGEVAARTTGLVQLLDGRLEAAERLVVVEDALHEAHPLGQLLPDLLAERGARMLLDGVVHDLREVLVLPVAAGESHEGEARRQQPAVREVVDGRHQLFT
jgi:hypothetical protein